jgi:Rieske 2Fe-2S family protein
MEQRATRTLPDRVYRDPALFEREMGVCFGSAWILAGHVSELREPGSMLPIMAGREPVVVLRDLEGRLRAMSNVCRHRASTLVDGPTVTRKTIRCPYHGWTYRFDGSLAAAPHGRGFVDLDRSAMGLPVYRVAEMAGLVFVCTDPATAPIEEVYGDVSGFFESLHLERRTVHRFSDTGAPGPPSRFQEDYDANWKTMVENYQEDYHVPVGHPALVRLLDIKETDGIDGQWGEASWVPLREQRSKRMRERLYQRLVRPMPGMPSQFDRAWGNAYLWPGTFFEIYPHHVDTWQLFPLDTERTRAVTMTLVDPEAKLRDRLARSLVHRIGVDVMGEDVTLTDRVVVGLRAPSYTMGVLNDQMESSVIRFHDMLRKRLPQEDL